MKIKNEDFFELFTSFMYVLLNYSLLVKMLNCNIYFKYNYTQGNAHICSHNQPYYLIYVLFPSIIDKFQIEKS